MLGLYGLAMVAVVAGMIIVMVPTVFAPGRVPWLLVPGVLLLLAGLATALLGQLTMMGKRLSLTFDAQGWDVKPVFGRAHSGKWSEVTAVASDDSAPGRVILALTDGRSLVLDIRWLDADKGEIERALQEHLNAAAGYRTLEETFGAESGTD